MADSWTQSVVCRYFKNGMCREGNNCRYRHTEGAWNDETNETIISSSVPPVNNICRFFKHENSSAGQHTSNISTSTTIKIAKDNIRNAEEWVKAPEFVPSHVARSSFTIEASTTSGTSTNSSMSISYAQAVNSSDQASSPSSEPLCPYAEATGICKKRDCTYLHGDICELCNRAALHPYNEELRKKHTNACVKQHEVDMELSFAIQRSREKSCGVCFEVIMEKASGEQRFGILPNCNHCFCLSCIRKWRQAKQFDNKIIRACPECRATSDFVCPSMYWVDNKEEKEKLITDYKCALSTKDCKYFNKGQGKCPFGNKCFYLHALPDGTKTDVGPPIRRRNADTDVDILRQIILWDFFEERDNRWIYDVDIEDIISLFSGSEESDWSEFEFQAE
ncbi:probable E3 ubiquitin-protein ligase makorin-1 isoform X2 [Bombus terrestris]|uniref:RING-type E3 ubiquitin transferase n=1 Tax=Bombus terrestris TaxID=30195 RepID=A0A9B2JPS8_BOMTE|nr:probable E3 ubiquitin-protein ligase makorin-1 isoform X2 [Bombus terrestris]